MVESDEEQVEVLKRWWEENGTTIIVTVVLALGGSFGYQAWQDNVRETGETASSLYNQLTVAAATISASAADDNIRQSTMSIAQTLKRDYESTTYATFAALHLAKIAADADDTATARAELEWALAQTDDALLETIVRTRLARLLLDAQDATAAMAVLINYEPAAGQVTSFEEVRGDVYHALGDLNNAREAYQLAIDNLGDESAKPLLELKLADIPLAVAVQDEPSVPAAEPEAPEGEPEALPADAAAVETEGDV